MITKAQTIIILLLLLVLHACKNEEMEGHITDSTQLQTHHFYDFNGKEKFFVFQEDFAYNAFKRGLLYYTNDQKLLFNEGSSGLTKVEGVYIGEDGTKIIQDLLEGFILFDEDFKAGTGFNKVASPDSMQHINYDPYSKSDFFIGKENGVTKFYRFTGNEFKAYDNPFSKWATPIYLSTDPSVGFWAYASYKLHRYFVGGTQTSFDVDSKVSELDISPNGDIYCLISGDIYEVKNGSLSEVFSGIDRISTFSFDADGNLWYCKNENLYKYTFSPTLEEYIGIATPNNTTILADKPYDDVYVLRNKKVYYHSNGKLKKLDI